jgi:hypothetical protein
VVNWNVVNPVSRLFYDFCSPLFAIYINGVMCIPFKLRFPYLCHSLGFELGGIWFRPLSATFPYQESKQKPRQRRQKRRQVSRNGSLCPGNERCAVELDVGFTELQVSLGGYLSWSKISHLPESHSNPAADYHLAEIAQSIFSRSELESLLARPCVRSWKCSACLGR